MRLRWFALLVFPALVLVGCGGGSGGSDAACRSAIEATAKADRAFFAFEDAEAVGDLDAMARANKTYEANAARFQKQRKACLR